MIKSEEVMAEEYIEVSEKTLDDAITAACRRLSVTSDKLEYVVVDQGSSGFLGFNARKAVRLPPESPGLQSLRMIMY